MTDHGHGSSPDGLLVPEEVGANHILNMGASQHKLPVAMNLVAGLRGVRNTAVSE